MTLPLPQWSEDGSNACFSDPFECATRSEQFARRIRMRNAMEYIAGGAVIVLSGAACLGALWFAQYLFAVAFGLIAAGGVHVLRNLRKRASNISREPEMPCLNYLRCQYVRQRDALRSVPRWYLAPFVPGLIVLFGLVTHEIARARGLGAALGAVAVPAGMVLITMLVVAGLNLWEAARLQRKIEQLDEITAAE